MKKEVSTTFRALKVVCDWNLDDWELENLDKVVTITWDHQGWIRMYDPSVPDGGYLGTIDYDNWTMEDLPALQEANELFDEKYH